MRFKVGPWTYTIRISDGQLRDANNRAVDGLCCWSDRTIWINSVLPLQQRAEILSHELAHAWTEAFGQPTDNEGHCNQAGSMMTDVRRQLERQGGENALMRLCANGVINYESSDESENDHYAVRCGHCGSLIAIGNVTTSPAIFSTGHGRAVVDRVAACADCEYLTSWTEGTTSGGRPNGRIVDGPRIDKMSFQQS